MGLIIHRRTSYPPPAHWWTYRAEDVAIATGISSAADRVGSKPLLQATAGWQPAYSATGINGLPAASHNGVDSAMYTAAFTEIYEPYTVAVAFQLGALEGGRRGVVADGSSGFEFGHNGSHWVATANGGSTDATSATAINTNPHFAVCRMRGDSSTEIRVDGSSIKTGDAGTNGISYMATGVSWYASNCEVLIGEVMLFDQDMSGPDLSGLESYLGRWIP